jgi:hypothetical protein
LYFAEVADHDIARLEVSVDHTRGVGVCNGLADLKENPEKPQPILARRRSRAEHLSPEAPLNELHREVGSAIRESADFMDRHDTRVLELGSDLGFLDEAASDGLAVGVLW